MSPRRLTRSPKGAVTQAGMISSIDAVQQCACFRRIKHRRLPGCYNVPWSAHRMRRINRHHLAVDEPIEQVPKRGEPLLDTWRGELARRRFDYRTDERAVLNHACWLGVHFQSAARDREPAWPWHPDPVADRRRQPLRARMSKGCNTSLTTFTPSSLNGGGRAGLACDTDIRAEFHGQGYFAPERDKMEGQERT